MAVFDTKIWKETCPRDLKGLKVEAACKSFNDQMPEQPKDVKLEDVYKERMEDIDDALSHASDIIGKKITSLENEYKAKKQKSDEKKKKSVEAEEEKAIRPYYTLKSQLKIFTDKVTLYKKDYQRIHERAKGNYQQHLAEVMEGYKTCMEAMEKLETNMGKVTAIVDKVQLTLSRLEPNMREVAVPKMLEALEMSEKKIEEINGKLMEINRQNKSANDPLRVMIVDYNIDPEVIKTGAISKMYNIQAASSVKTVNARKRNAELIKTLREQLQN